MSTISLDIVEVHEALPYPTLFLLKLTLESFERAKTVAPKRIIGPPNNLLAVNSAVTIPTGTVIFTVKTESDGSKSIVYP